MKVNRWHDLSDIDKIIAIYSLYESTKIIQDKKKNDYYHFIKETEDDNYVTLLDITTTKKEFEIVHFHKINRRNLKKLILKNK